MKYNIANSKGNKIKTWIELSSKFNLSFSRCVAIGNKFFGLDRKKRRLFVSAVDQDITGSHLIDLEKIKSVSVTKTYDSIKAGELTKRKLEEFLNSIHLRFEYFDMNETLFPFYEKRKDSIMDVSKMDLASKDFQLILSKLIGSPKTAR